MSRADALARNFPENGMKLLLELPGNVRDLLGLAGRDIREDIVQPIDLDRLLAPRPARRPQIR